MRLDTLVKNVSVVRPDVVSAPDGEKPGAGIVDGHFARAEANIPENDAGTVTVERGLAFPGVVEAHQHWGIYNSLRDDAATEGGASTHGGVGSRRHDLSRTSVVLM